MAGGDDCRSFGGVVPYDDMPSSAVDLAGRVAELVDRLRSALDALRGPQAVAGWVGALASGTALLASVPPGDEWQVEQLRRELADVGDAAAAGGPELSLDEVRHLLAARLQGRPTRANFRTGDLTVCTLVPMRSVPHRVVALLGLDDGTFPRHPEPDGDDLVAADPFVGDRDPRSEDRQMLLDALLAAGDHLLVTYSGRDERTNRSRPPAVPVSELLDVVDATVRTVDGSPVRERVLWQHPLQPFDPANFTAGSLGRSGSWSFDRVQLAGSVASGRRSPPAPWLDGPLPPLTDPVLRLDDLVHFVEHPVRAFLRRRLGLYLAGDDDPPSDAIPTELDGLGKWGVGTRLLQARRAGTDAERALAAERGRGLLPPEVLARSVLVEVAGEVERLMTALGDAAGPADSLDVHLDLPDGRRVVGTVPGLRSGRVVVCTYSRLAPKHRLAAWVRHLALSAARPDLPVETRTLGRGPARGQPPWVAQLPALAADPDERRTRAMALLGGLVDLYDRGMREPLPLMCATSAAWAAAVHAGRPEEAFGRAVDEWADRWHDDQPFPKEQKDPNHVRVWGAGCELRDLAAVPPRDGEAGPWCPAGVTGRVGVLAWRLWAPLLDVERLGRCQ
jgi:exodeoxyribonuclease V gamma subunit